MKRQILFSWENRIKLPSAELAKRVVTVNKQYIYPDTPAI